MSAESYLLFPPFRFDSVNEQLWRGAKIISLRRKTFAVLRYLLEHPGQLVTKEQLLEAVWPGTYVSESMPTICVRELRKALNDDAKTPRFIETVHGRGYRFIAPLASAPPVASSQHSVASSQKAQAESRKLTTNNWQLTTPLVGRDTELVQLDEWLEKALSGERQLVFITGEPGIGKTTVVEAFLKSLESSVLRLVSEDYKRSLSEVQTLDPRRQTLDGRLWIGRGQCIEHYGAGEAYMPVLEALGRLCREPEGEQLIDLLGQYAPSWLAQMPTLLSAAALEALQRKVQGATRERMLREMAEAVEALTAERPLALRLEDLHWSDVSTLELLSVLARRQERARLLVLGTYRPVEMLGNGHPLRAVKQELQLHKQCEELRLGFLTEQNVAEYLATRFRLVPSPARGEGQDGGASRQQFSRRPPHPIPLPRGEREAVSPAASLQGLARMVHQRTDGNSLFMVNIVDYLIVQGMLGESGETQPAVQIEVPESIQQIIEKQIDRLSPEEQHVLEVASVAGAQFSAAAVAAGTKITTGDVEACCTGLARREQFLRTNGVSEWPDGTVATRYSFLHALYQEVLYERIPAGQRVALHSRIGEREEQAYGDRARDIAAELAVHFERGRDYCKAVQYLQQAGENALRRSAHREAISLLTVASRTRTGRSGNYPLR